MQDPSAKQLQARLKAYFATLARCGAVAPAERFRLEGYLQAQLDSGAIGEAELGAAIDRHIASFNSGSVVQLEAQSPCWALPCTSPPAPVTPSGDK